MFPLQKKNYLLYSHFLPCSTAFLGPQSLYIFYPMLFSMLCHRIIWCRKNTTSSGPRRCSLRLPHRMYTKYIVYTARFGQNHDCPSHMFCSSSIMVPLVWVIGLQNILPPISFAFTPSFTLPPKSWFRLISTSRSMPRLPYYISSPLLRFISSSRITLPSCSSLTRSTYIWRTPFSVLVLRVLVRHARILLR